MAITEPGKKMMLFSILVELCARELVLINDVERLTNMGRMRG